VLNQDCTLVSGDEALSQLVTPQAHGWWGPPTPRPIVTLPADFGEWSAQKQWDWEHVNNEYSNRDWFDVQPQRLRLAREWREREARSFQRDLIPPHRDVAAKHDQAVAVKTEQLRVDRDARTALAVEMGAFGVFDTSHVIDINDFGDKAATSYIIDHLLEEGATTMLFADWYVGKSFLALDWACCVATGSSWDGREVKAGRVLYVALEGRSTFRKRFAAWRAHTDRTVPRGALEVYPATINMLDPTSVGALAVYVRAGKFDLVVIDTLSRSITGADENSTELMGRFIASVAQVREAHEQSHVLVLHHSKKDDIEKYRGNSTLAAGFDNIMCLRRLMLGDDPSAKADPRRLLIFQKTKDGLTPNSLNLIFEQVPSTESAVLVRDTLAGIPPIVQHLMTLQANPPGTVVTRTELKKSLVAAGLYGSESVANARISALLKEGSLVFDQATSEVSVGVIGRKV